MDGRSTALETKECSLSDGRTLTYTRCGPADGVPVVAHHGTPGSRSFGALLSDAAAAEGVSLLVPDRPGYGRSSPPPDGWTWDDWTDDLDELTAAEGIEDAGVVGFSGGGPFAVAAARNDWATRLALVSAVRPPVENTLTRLSTVPFALRLVFRISATIARLSGPQSVVSQYTDRTVPEPVATAVARDFREALRQDARAVTRETRAFSTDSLAGDRSTAPIRAWHGTDDENAPPGPIRSFVRANDGTLITPETDHLGTLLDHRRGVLAWLAE